MPRKLRPPKLRTTTSTGALVLYKLLHGTLPADQSAYDPAEAWDAFQVGPHDPAHVAALWAAVEADVMPEWIAQTPGTRPWCWWLVSAPRWRQEDMPPHQRAFGDWARLRLPEPRRGLGGIGMPDYEVQNVFPVLEFGLPTRFITESDIAVYLGEAVDVEGNPMLRDLRRPGFMGAAVDPNDPPRYEAQASYLHRHNLLLPGEAERLTAEDFAPEAIDVVTDRR